MYAEEQIIAVRKEGEACAKVAALCRRHGMSDASYHHCKPKHAATTVSSLRHLKASEAESRRLKQIVAEYALDNLALKQPLSKTSDAQDEETGGHACGDQSWAEYQKSLPVGGCDAGKL